MMGRMYAPSWPRATWLMHQDVWAQLPLISFRDIGAYPSVSTGSAQCRPTCRPSGISGAPYGTLFGRPIHVLEAMETIGDLGDIAAVDMSQYRAVTKAGGTRRHVDPPEVRHRRDGLSLHLPSGRRALVVVDHQPARRQQHAFALRHAGERAKGSGA
jgi:HK97 family phage major capsid protein